MPRSRSRSFESIARSGSTARESSVPDCCNSLSTSVVLPWSTWAMMAMLRMRSCLDIGDPGIGVAALDGARARKIRN
jgi:hypothetical protein